MIPYLDCEALLVAETVPVHHSFQSAASFSIIGPLLGAGYLLENVASELGLGERWEKGRLVSEERRVGELVRGKCDRCGGSPRGGLERCPGGLRLAARRGRWLGRRRLALLGWSRARFLRLHLGSTIHDLHLHLSRSKNPMEKKVKRYPIENVKFQNRPKKCEKSVLAAQKTRLK